MNITNINFNDLIPNFRVYYRDDKDEIIARTIEYIRNPDENNPNIQVELDQLPNPFLPSDLNDFENPQQPPQPDQTKKIIQIKFIGEEEEIGNVHLNDNNKVTILVMTEEFVFYETELQKPLQKTRGKAGGKRRLSKKRKLSRKKRKLSRKKRKLFRKKVK